MFKINKKITSAITVFAFVIQVLLSAPLGTQNAFAEQDPVSQTASAPAGVVESPIRIRLTDPDHPKEGYIELGAESMLTATDQEIRNTLDWLSHLDDTAVIRLIEARDTETQSEKFVSVSYLKKEFRNQLERNSRDVTRVSGVLKKISSSILTVIRPLKVSTPDALTRFAAVAGAQLIVILSTGDVSVLRATAAALQPGYFSALFSQYAAAFTTYLEKGAIGSFVSFLKKYRKKTDIPSQWREFLIRIFSNHKIKRVTQSIFAGLFRGYVSEVVYVYANSAWQVLLKIPRKEDFDNTDILLTSLWILGSQTPLELMAGYRSAVLSLPLKIQFLERMARTKPERFKNYVETLDKIPLNDLDLVSQFFEDHPELNDEFKDANVNKLKRINRFSAISLLIGSVFTTGFVLAFKYTPYDEALGFTYQGVSFSMLISNMILTIVGLPIFIPLLRYRKMRNKALTQNQLVNKALDAKGICPSIFSSLRTIR